MLSNSHHTLRPLAWLEGGSLLLLVLLAMPLKYFAGFPLAVRVVGPIHGFFFTAYCIMLVDIHLKQRWAPKETALYFVAALLPFGAFVLDQRLKKALATGQSLPAS